MYVLFQYILKYRLKFNRYYTFKIEKLLLDIFCILYRSVFKCSIFGL